MTPEQIKQLAKQAGGIQNLQYIALDPDALAELVRLVRESDRAAIEQPTKGLFIDMIAEHEGLADELAAQPDYVPLSDRQIVQLAMGTEIDGAFDVVNDFARAIERAVRLVRADALDEAAAMCEHISTGYTSKYDIVKSGIAHCATTIRELK